MSETFEIIVGLVGIIVLAALLSSSVKTESYKRYKRQTTKSRADQRAAYRKNAFKKQKKTYYY